MIDKFKCKSKWIDDMNKEHNFIYRSFFQFGQRQIANRLGETKRKADGYYQEKRIQKSYRIHIDFQAMHEGGMFDAAA
jgi:hypothetical protein